MDQGGPDERRRDLSPLVHPRDEPEELAIKGHGYFICAVIAYFDFFPVIRPARTGYFKGDCLRARTIYLCTMSLLLLLLHLLLLLLLLLLLPPPLLHGVPRIGSPFLFVPVCFDDFLADRGQRWNIDRYFLEYTDEHRWLIQECFPPLPVRSFYLSISAPLCLSTVMLLREEGTLSCCF